MPFRLYDFQIEYVNWLEERYQAGQDGGTEKSRDMGASWCVLAWLMHHWIFDSGFQALVGSRKEDLVDNGELDSLFGKLDFIVRHLPDWQVPVGWNPRRHRTYMTLDNPANGNAIIGESSNPNFSRQGRYSVIVLDEFAFWEWARTVWTATADASPCRIPLSTPNGANFFRELRFGGRIPFYTLHWRQHPRKSEAWYVAEQARRTAEDVAQELDISYDRSVRGKVYPEWGDIPKGCYPYQPGWPLFISWDFGLDDNTALVWWQRNPNTGKYRAIDCYTNSGKLVDFYLPFCKGATAPGLPPFGYSQTDLLKIGAHRQWGAARHRGDPAGNQRNQVNGLSVIATLRQHDIQVENRPAANTFEARWRLTKLFLRQVEGVSEATCSGLNDAMVNARFPERPESSQATTENSKPIHDWTSHFRTAVEYMAVVEMWKASPGRQLDFEVDPD